MPFSDLVGTIPNRSVGYAVESRSPRQLSRSPAGRFDDGVDVGSLFGRNLQHLRTLKIARPVERLHAGMPGDPNHWMAG
jgi:hypothetical protein